jgi:hypothetical protein
MPNWRFIFLWIQIIFVNCLGRKLGKECKFCQGNDQSEGTTEGGENQLDSCWSDYGSFFSFFVIKKGICPNERF